MGLSTSLACGLDPVVGTKWSSSSKGLQPGLCMGAVPGPMEPPATPSPCAQASCAEPTDWAGKRNQNRRCQRLPEPGRGVSLVSTQSCIQENWSG